MFRRKIWNEIEDWRQSKEQRSLLIEGARQCGKTFIIREFGKSNYGHVIELNFEDNPEYAKIFSKGVDSKTVIDRLKETFGHDSVVPGDTLIFLDEIQSCSESWTSLKSLAQNPDYDVIASGSFLGLMYRQEAFSPGGYVRILRMGPMDFEEFSWANGITERTIEGIRECIRAKRPLDGYDLDLMEDLHVRYILTGGMPAAVRELMTSRDLDRVREQTSHIREIYRSDVVKYVAPNSRDDVFDVFDSVPKQLAKEENRFLYTDIEVSNADDDKDNKDRARSRIYKKAIDWLIDSGVCMECTRVSDTKIPLTGREGLFRLYMCDIGVLTSMIPRDSVIPAFLNGDSRTNRGYIMENCIATHLRNAGLELMYYKRKTTEVDFITSMEGTVVGIEVKSGNNNMSRSLKSLMDRGMIDRAVKFETCNIHVDKNGIEHYPRFVVGFIDSLYEHRRYTLEPLKDRRSDEDGSASP